jgi:hypothetical protein
MSWRARLAGLAVAAALATPVAAAEKKDTGEGIKVHGHWTIDVRNPDGSLASHHEIENALEPSTGPRLLAGLLGNFWGDVRWSVGLSGTPPPCDPAPPDTSCGIHQPSLVVTLPMTSGVPTGTLELSGSVTMARNSTISLVFTVWEAVNTTGPPVLHRSMFSARAINIQVVQGQIVQVKVVFSFS